MSLHGRHRSKPICLTIDLIRFWGFLAAKLESGVFLGRQTGWVKSKLGFGRGSGAFCSLEAPGRCEALADPGRGFLMWTDAQNEHCRKRKEHCSFVFLSPPFVDFHLAFSICTLSILGYAPLCSTPPRPSSLSLHFTPIDVTISRTSSVRLWLLSLSG